MAVQADAVMAHASAAKETEERNTSNADFMSPVGSDLDSGHSGQRRFWKRKRTDYNTSAEETSEVEAPPTDRLRKAKRGRARQATSGKNVGPAKKRAWLKDAKVVVDSRR